MTLYGLKSCDTCRKALAALRDAGHEVHFVDVRADGIDDATRARFIAAFGPAIVNTRSTTWRGLTAEEQAEEPADQLAAHPTLMKRPVVEADGRLHLGWGKDVQAELL
ncbi:MAG: ArsC/Spx/MgsR family protein [Pseudomonadota bacterium]